MLPHNLSQFPTDSAFIERAARFSSFSGGHFGDLLNCMGMSQSCGPFGQDGVIMQGPQAMMGRQSQKPEASLADVSKDVCLVPGNGAIDGNSPKNEMMVERSRDEAKQGVMLGNESDEPECSRGFAKDIDAKKRGNQAEQANANDLQSGEAKKNSDIQQKGDQNSTPISNKSNGKQVKQNSQASDSPKEKYIHVRARRGEATNSHSLTERDRRDRINEKMKFLRDLVPGCRKVTGKAGMLDEIINYVQSLQRQVEFLSMKLATVNPQLDFNIDRFLTKDAFSARAWPSSGPTFSPGIPMPYHPLHPGQSPMLPPVLSGTGNPNDALRRVIASQLPNMGGGCKEPSSQYLPNAWDGELHNIVHMGFNANAPLDKQDGTEAITIEIEGSSRSFSEFVGENLSQANVRCNHGMNAKLEQCKRGANAGKLFFSCPLWKVSNCDFFKWFDDAQCQISSSNARKLKTMSENSTNSTILERIDLKEFSRMEAKVEKLKDKLQKKDFEIETLKKKVMEMQTEKDVGKGKEIALYTMLYLSWLVIFLLLFVGVCCWV